MTDAAALRKTISRLTSSIKSATARACELEHRAMLEVSVWNGGRPDYGEAGRLRQRAWWLDEKANRERRLLEVASARLAEIGDAA